MPLITVYMDTGISRQANHAVQEYMRPVHSRCCYSESISNDGYRLSDNTEQPSFHYTCPGSWTRWSGPLRDHFDGEGKIT